MSVPTTADVDRIVALPDSIVRNLQITQCYHELTKALAARLPGDANWCTFATWASKQAGQSIRGQDLSRTLERRLEQSPKLHACAQVVAAQLKILGVRLDVSEVRQVVEDAFDLPEILARSSVAVARGNLKVFEEIGRAFAGFLDECVGDLRFDARHIDTFCERLRAGDPPDGQRYLRQSFNRYYQALFERDANRRAEMLLLANLEVAFHEQTRLQPQILEALNAGIPDSEQITGRVVARLFPRRAASILSARGVLRRVFGPTPLSEAVRSMVEQVRREVRLVLTEYLMSLTLPHGVVLNLGDDLRARFPDALVRIDSGDLQALLVRIDPTPDDVRRSGASDWADLSERLHFVADLFRCYHASRDLFDPPFTSEQVAALKAGRLPAGRL